MEQEVYSLAAEIAVSRLIGHDWQDTPLPDPEGDCGPGVQCKWTDLNNGRMIVHPEMVDDHRCWLVTGAKMADLCIRGWAFVGDCKKEEWWPGPHPNRPAFFVPQRFLNAPETWQA